MGKVRSDNMVLYKDTAGVENVCSGPCFLHAIVIGTAGSDVAPIKIIDANAGQVPLVAEFPSDLAPGTYPINIKLATTLRINNPGSAKMSVIYRRV